jgi:hypothetical protein
MDATRRVNLLDERGVALVYLAVVLVVLLGLAALAIDMGYMYVNKAKLQNAADAGALAGAGRLFPGPYTEMTSARRVAKTFADSNFGLNLDTNTTNDPGGDIVLGNWNRASTPPFTPSGTPLNAVKVLARRTGDTGTGIGPNSKFDLFFSKVLGVNTMGAAASAIAYRPARARTFFMVGRGVCSSTTFPVTLTPATGFNNLAWTSLLEPSTNSNDVRDDFFCPAEKLPFAEVCGKSVYTSNGVVSSVFKSVEVDFYDLNYDAANKTFAGTGNNRYVTSWRVIVPVSEENDPSVQPVPHLVWGYAQITISRACGSGGGNACPSRGNINAPGGVCSGGEDAVVISEIACSDCAHSNFLGAMPVLAE